MKRHEEIIEKCDNIIYILHYRTFVAMHRNFNRTRTAQRNTYSVAIRNYSILHYFMKPKNKMYLYGL